MTEHGISDAGDVYDPTGAARPDLPEPKRRRNLGDEHYRQVAAQLSWAREIGVAPSDYVAHHFGVTLPTLDRWIAEAKKRGFLRRDWSTAATEGGRTVSTDPRPRKRTRRAEPITKHVAQNGVVSYRFRVDVGTRPDGSRERQWFTYSTQAEARKEYRRITTEVAAGTFVRRDKTTVEAFLSQWLDGRRDVRPVTIAGYRFALKPVIETLGAMPLQQLRAADVDALVTVRMARQPVATSADGVARRCWPGCGTGSRAAASVRCTPSSATPGRRRWRDC